VKLSWMVIAGTAFVAGLSVIAVDPALARSKHHGKRVTQRQCVDRPYDFSLSDWLFAVRPHPQWNGCAPPVYVSGEYIGQDPDPNIRAQLKRDPETGYTSRR
jgi:hypothetical protein